MMHILLVFVNEPTFNNYAVVLYSLHVLLDLEFELNH